MYGSCFLEDKYTLLLKENDNIQITLMEIIDNDISDTENVDSVNRKVKKQFWSERDSDNIRKSFRPSIRPNDETQKYLNLELLLSKI